MRCRKGFLPIKAKQTRVPTIIAKINATTDKKIVAKNPSKNSGKYSPMVRKLKFANKFISPKRLLIFKASALRYSSTDYEEILMQTS